MLSKVTGFTQRRGLISMKYSKLIVLFSISFACVAINYRLVTTGHYRAPLFVFIACLIAVPLIFRRLPPVTSNPPEIRRNQSKAASAFRRIGFIYIFGFVFGLINLGSGGFKELPAWGIFLIFCWSGFLIWGCFWAAKRFAKNAADRDAVPSEAPKV